MFTAGDARTKAEDSNDKLQDVLKMIKGRAKQGKTTLHLSGKEHEKYIKDIPLRNFLKRLNYGVSSQRHCPDILTIEW